MACCARHGVPLKLVDMHFGERFAYLQLLLNSISEKNNGVKIVVFYDVACHLKPHCDVRISTMTII